MHRTGRRGRKRSAICIRIRVYRELEYLYWRTIGISRRRDASRRLRSTRGRTRSRCANGSIARGAGSNRCYSKVSQLVGTSELERFYVRYIYPGIRTNRRIGKYRCRYRRPDPFPFLLAFAVNIVRSTILMLYEQPTFSYLNYAIDIVHRSECINKCC